MNSSNNRWKFQVKPNSREYCLFFKLWAPISDAQKSYMGGSIHILCEVSVSYHYKQLSLLTMMQCIATVCFLRKLLFLFPAFPITNSNLNGRLNARKDLRDETISLSLGTYPNLNQSTTHRGTNFNVRIDINYSARFCYWKNTQQALSTEMSITKDIFSEPYACPILAQKRPQNIPAESYHFCDRV